VSGVRTYRKRPVEIEAVKFAKPYNNAKKFCPHLVLVKDGNQVAWGAISTLEGEMRADVGDYIIRGVQGEFYPCKPDIFEQTYEAVTPDARA